MSKVTVEVDSHEQAAAVRRAFADPATRAAILVVGTLLALPSDRDRRRVIARVSELLAEKQA